MKRTFYILSLLAFSAIYLFAEQPKREVRSVWLSTVWRLDWPSVTVPAPTGTNDASREAARNVQKSGLIDILEKIKNANFNTVFFQVRGMSDAFYNSQYEPWSQYLSSERGADPGWDPLDFIIKEAHARGIEVHAWINPYRYSSSSESHGNLATDYSNTHPKWLMDYGSSKKILNPGMPEVRQRICDVVGDIVTNYDVDGIVFDDYFYMANTTNAMDAEQYQQYNPNNLTRANWRRENVNKMVQEVQARINSIKPYISFGISPAGVAASSPSVASQYGVDPCPAGSDWQYNGIYSDPLAWISRQSIDYISPQIYWKIGATNDYSKISPWWAKISNYFGRHYYSSNKSPLDTTELISQIEINRDADLNGATGCVYFRVKDLPSKTLTVLKSKPYQYPALGAIYGWKPAPTQGLVENLFLSGQNLTWSFDSDNMRYAVYAVPRSKANETDIFTTGKYLTGVSYKKSFKLPSGINSASHVIAVAVYDRYGHLSAPRILNDLSKTVDPAQLTYPQQNGSGIILPALFSWQPVDEAAYYVWELAEDEAFNKPIISREVETASFYSGLQTNIKENATYYWRVKTIKPNAPVSISEVRSFAGTKFKITAPANGSTNVPMTAEVSWTGIAPGTDYTLEISNKADFSTLVYSVQTQNTTASVPEGELLFETVYYVRVRADKNGMTAISERVAFTTATIPVPRPIITSPANETTVNDTKIELAWQEQPSKGFRAELSTSSDFPPRNTTRISVEPSIYNAIFKKLKTNTYYIRVLAETAHGFTDPSDYITVYLDASTGIQTTEGVDLYYYCDANGTCHIVIENPESATAEVTIYSLSGVAVSKNVFDLHAGKNTLTPDMTNCGTGLYLVKIKTNNTTQIIKIKR